MGNLEKFMKTIREESGREHDSIGWYWDYETGKRIYTKPEKGERV